MKKILLLVCALVFAFRGLAAPTEGRLESIRSESDAASGSRQAARAISVACAAVEAAEIAATQAIDCALRDAQAAVDAAVEAAVSARATADAGVLRAANSAVGRAGGRTVVRTFTCTDDFAAGGGQSLDDLNAAAREEVVRELRLTKKQRKEFEPIYKAYRKALDKAVDASAATANPVGEAERQQVLKAKLDNIAATAQVKRDYVDRFAQVLTAEQIRILYNTEGRIGSSIKRATGRGADAGRVTRLRGSGRKVTQDWGAPGAYDAIAAATFFEITVSPAVSTIRVTADDNVIDHLSMERDGGKLSFRLDARETQNVTVSIVVPASPALRTVSAASYGKVICKTPLKGNSVHIDIASYGRVEAAVETPGTAHIGVSSYGKFAGSIRCGACDLDISSYGSVQSPVVCRGRCEIRVGSYAKYADTVEASDLTLSLHSGAGFSGDLTAGALSLSVSSYADFAGTIHSDRTKILVSSGGTVSGTFAGNELEASVGSYGKMLLRGSATVRSASVAVSSGGSFQAPELRVGDYSITASGYSKADVWCSGNLKINASSTADIAYGGPCNVESQTGNIRRKR